MDFDEVEKLQKKLMATVGKANKDLAMGRQWEYQVEFILDNSPTIIKAALNEFGRDHWELVSATDKLLYFKRPMPSAADLDLGSFFKSFTSNDEGDDSSNTP